MSERLPTGWTEAAIGALNYHKSASITPSDYPEEIFELYSVPIFPTGNPEFISGKDIGSSKQMVLPGDVLLCKINPRINRVWVVSEKADYRQIASSEWIVIRNDNLSSKYLINALSRREFREQLCSEVTGVGGSLTRAQPKKVAGYSIPIAPFPEQIRIADKIDRILARVNAAQARLDKIPALIKRFRQTVLAEATSGELTREWREDRGLGWSPNIVAVQDVVSDEKYSLGIGPFGSNLKVSDYREEGHPLIFVREIRSKFSGETETKYIERSKFEELKAHQAEPGDILITKMGDPPGDVAIYPFDRPTGVITSDCIKIRVNENLVTRDFAVVAFRSELFQDQIKVITAGVAQQKVSLKKFKTLEVVVPCLVEQHEIVRRVESLFALADSVEKQYQDAKARTDRLTQAILAKAFRGELVPQDPTDEPADVLLERIQAQRAEQAAAPKKRKSKMKAGSKKTALSGPETEKSRKTRTGKKSSKVINVTQSVTSSDDLLSLLKALGEESVGVDASILWKKSGLSIDDFYALLKQTEQIEDHVPSSDPAQRKLRVRK